MKYQQTHVATPPGRTTVSDVLLSCLIVSSMLRLVCLSRNDICRLLALDQVLVCHQLLQMLIDIQVYIFYHFFLLPLCTIYLFILSPDSCFLMMIFVRKSETASVFLKFKSVCFCIRFLSYTFPLCCSFFFLYC